MLEKTKAFCDSFLDMGLPGFDITVFKGGECVLRHFNGYSDLENKVKINGKERYNIYSCSKPLTCTAVLQLWEKGMFSLEDKLSDYMPEFENMTVQTDDGIKKAENPILIKHLFEMTSGLSYSLDSPYFMQCKEETDGKCQTRETMRYAAKEPLCFEPGERWQYSMAHDVLAALVEVLTGERFENYVKKNIFDVLGMTRSTYLLPDDELETVAEQYKFEDGKPVNIGKPIMPFFKIGSEYASGGAGCISTVEDYIKFLEGLRTGVLLKKETVELMSTNRLTEQQRSTFWLKDTHGYGLGVRCCGGDERYLDFGWDGAAGSFAAIDTKNEISIFFACHLHLLPFLSIRSLLYRFVKAELLSETDLNKLLEELKELHNFELQE